MSASVRYCGREFPASELALIRALIAQRQPRLSRSALSRAPVTRPAPAFPGQRPALPGAAARHPC